jgi:hypothetical protein
MCKIRGSILYDVLTVLISVFNYITASLCLEVGFCPL